MARKPSTNNGSPAMRLKSIERRLTGLEKVAEDKKSKGTSSVTPRRRTSGR